MSIKMFRAPTVEEIIQARKREFVTIVLSVFGDESTDQTARRVFTVAGIAGTQEEWDALEPVWIKRTGGRAFHASRGVHKISIRIGTFSFS